MCSWRKYPLVGDVDGGLDVSDGVIAGDPSIGSVDHAFAGFSVLEQRYTGPSEIFGLVGDTQILALGEVLTFCAEDG